MRAMGLVWYRPEDYQHIREISDDEMRPTFARKFHGGRIDTKVRSEFAARKVAAKYGTDH